MYLTKETFWWRCCFRRCSSSCPFPVYIINLFHFADELSTECRFVIVRCLPASCRKTSLPFPLYFRIFCCSFVCSSLCLVPLFIMSSLEQLLILLKNFIANGRNHYSSHVPCFIPMQASVREYYTKFLSSSTKVK